MINIQRLKTGLALASFFLLAAATQIFGGAGASVDERFLNLRGEHTQVVKRLSEDNGIEAAKQTYVETLNTLSRDYRLNGDLAGHDSCMAEQRRFAREGTVPDSPPEDLPAPLKEAQARFRQTVQAAAQNQMQRIAEEQRKYRMALLDLHRSAVSSDDDDLADAIHREIEKTDAMILDAEARLARAAPEQMDPADRLPAGLERQLVLHYPFHRRQGPRVADHSGMNNHGTMHGARWSGRGRRGGAIWLDGIDDAVEVPGSASLQPHGGLTVSVCVFPQPDQGRVMDLTGHVLSKSTEADADYRLYISPGGTVGAVLDFQEPGMPPVRIHSDPAGRRVSVDQWSHIVLVCDGRTAHVYVNGELDKTVTVAGGMGVSDAAVHIGRCGTGTWSYGFTGRVDDVMIWGRALSEAEVLGLWASLKRTAIRPDFLGPYH